MKELSRWPIASGEMRGFGAFTVINSNIESYYWVGINRRYMKILVVWSSSILEQVLWELCASKPGPRCFLCTFWPMYHSSSLQQRLSWKQNLGSCQSCVNLELTKVLYETLSFQRGKVHNFVFHCAFSRSLLNARRPLNWI